MKILGWIFIVLGILLAIGYWNQRKEEPNKKKAYLAAFIASIVMALVGVMLIRVNSIPSSNSDSAPKTAKTTKTAKTSQSSSSRKPSGDSNDLGKKEKQEVDKKKAANERQNFASYKRALTQLPAKTKHVVTSAKVDPTSGETVVVLYDDALSLSTNELKNLAKTTWITISNMRDSYTPFPDNDSSSELYTTIEDSAGNKIAHTSLLGNFKFDSDN
ncbi:DUF308 domain-containing protein [Secundilactobacillus kimchicus]|uniref:DUF308 domain-containing protein n=1 Tax=Secundilactobacillus kimchicus TaxID=528209 RepID=UPI0024A7D44F|nr:DUF308 domain-containing protein [Secundilactobacillus kimchicus]